MKCVSREGSSAEAVLASASLPEFLRRQASAVDCSSMAGWQTTHRSPTLFGWGQPKFSYSPADMPAPTEASRRSSGFRLTGAEVGRFSYLQVMSKDLPRGNRRRKSYVHTTNRPNNWSQLPSSVANQQTELSPTIDTRNPQHQLSPPTVAFRPSGLSEYWAVFAGSCAPLCTRFSHLSYNYPADRATANSQPCRLTHSVAFWFQNWLPSDYGKCNDKGSR
jgi:hypothetical protein